MSDGDPSLRARLERTLGLVQASDLSAHLARDAVIVVSPTLSIVDCAEAIARDDKHKVSAWLAEGAVRKATGDERERWPTERERQWLAVVVQPFVLVQTQEVSA